MCIHVFCVSKNTTCTCIYVTYKISLGLQESGWSKVETDHIILRCAGMNYFLKDKGRERESRG